MSEKIRQMVIQAIQESGLSQREVAEKTGIVTAQLNRYLTGKADMKTDTLHRLLLALGKDLKMVKKQMQD